MSAPKRIQRKRTAGWRMPEGAVYVGRGSKWGNPFVVGQTQIRVPGLAAGWEYEGRLHKTTGQRTFYCTGTDDAGMPVGFWHDVQLATREQCVELYRLRALGLDLENLGRGEPLAHVRAELGGRDLACWCPLDQPCHADVLLEIANAPGAAG
ncbi:DUF4326 domain-containing protein [Nocardia farcinica]|uniref:DUF4326 domain-containing protein n=1 Tax=Nocardia farcinica TaxID=37329 RepID=UPI002454C5DD|nr:DUF4326 domain-containing protein [Nocardia farcinica]